MPFKRKETNISAKHNRLKNPNCQGGRPVGYWEAELVSRPRNKFILVCTYDDFCICFASRVYDVNSGKQTRNYKGTQGDDGTLLRVGNSAKCH